MRTDKVYQLHFDRPISSAHTTQHYIGSAADVEARLAEHRAGTGARLTQVANERGIGYSVVRTWDAPDGKGRQLERQLKNQKQGPRLCPICEAKRKAEKAH